LTQTALGGLLNENGSQEIVNMNKTMQAGVEVERPEVAEPAPVDQSRTKRQPPYAVILHNDDVNGFDYVVGVLRKVFHYGRVKAFRLTLATHLRGQSIVWSGVLEVAELKADQLRSCGPDPRMASLGALSLRVTVEPLPGD
jgi:ATP-dependent Clp protease adaptor protein ClpS